MNVFQKIINNNLKTKAWTIRAAKTDVKKKKIDMFNDIEDVIIKLVITKLQNDKDLMITFVIDEQEYSFIANDQLLNFINEKNIEN